MKLKNSIKFFVSFVFVGLWISCSNNVQPVSVDSNTGNNVTAALSGLQIQDMGWAGGQLWAVSKTQQGNDYRLAIFLNNNWQYTSNYGLKCAVSHSGKCYHVNSSNQLWWVTRNANGTFTSQQITTLPANKSPKDIGAGVYNGNDRIWVRFKDNSGNYTVSYADYSGSGSSVIGGTSGWNQRQVWGGAPTCVSSDPYNGFFGAGIGSTDNTINVWEPDANGANIPDLNCNLTDIATCDGKYVVTTDDQKIYRGDNYSSWTVVNRFAKSYGVGMMKLSGVVYVMYINNSNNLEYCKFDDLHN
jgi:hypothetical protein